MFSDTMIVIVDKDDTLNTDLFSLSISKQWWLQAGTVKQWVHLLHEDTVIQVLERLLVSLKQQQGLLDNVPYNMYL